MVSKMQQVETEGAEEESVVDPEVIIVSPEEGKAIFDEAAWSIMGMSGDEFIRRWESGEYDEIVDTAGYRHIWDLVFLIPFARQED
jgi:hypothetical protein